MTAQIDRQQLFHDRAEADLERLVDEHIDGLDDADMVDLLAQCCHSFGYIKRIVRATAKSKNMATMEGMVVVTAPAALFADILRSYVGRVYGDDLVEKYAEALADEDAKKGVAP